MKEKALDKIRYHSIKMKRIKIKDTRITNDRIFQENQIMFYRKTQGTKQLKGKGTFLGRNLGRQHQNITMKMNEQSCQDNRTITNEQEFTIAEKKLYETRNKKSVCSKN